MKRVKVLHYVPGFDHGGIESRLLDWYRNVNRENLQFDVLIHTSLDNPAIRELETLGGRAFSIGHFHPLRLRQFFQNLTRFFAERETYDIAHCHSMETSFLVMKAAKRAGTDKLILHSRARSHATQSAVPVRRLMKYLSVRAATDFFACSEEAAAFMTEDIHWCKPDVTVVRNGFQADQFRFDSGVRREVRAELHVNDAFLLLTVGRLSAVKNQPFLLDVFAEIRRRTQTAKLLIVGEGPMRSALERRADYLGISDDVLLVGNRRDVPKLMQAADFFVLPSMYEGFGTAAVEAQAAGLPSLVSTGVPESVRATDLLKRLPLADGPVRWADEILRTDPGVGRRDTFMEIEAAGFNAAGTARFLEQFYVNASRCGRGNSR